MRKGKMFCIDKGNIKVEIYDGNPSAYLEITDGENETVLGFELSEINDLISTLTAARDAMEEGE